MKAALTRASTAIADWTPLTVVCRSWTTAEIDTFISDVSMTKTNIAIASRIASLGLPVPATPRGLADHLIQLREIKSSDPFSVQHHERGHAREVYHPQSRAGLRSGAS